MSVTPLRQQGSEMNPNEKQKALDAALALDPYYLPALLAKAQRMERLGARPSAALLYRNAIKIAPPQPQWPDHAAAPARTRQRIRGQACARHA
ncbi:MAG: hypothetical protein HC784_02445, partial [Hydrococcus sp. CSU_1_8]|nr:hypothetical protein [Hydrococcus sp. CSU_1_8]